MRLVLVLLVLVFAASGAIFGALNSESVTYDFYFATFNAPKGAILIVAMLVGWLLGGVLAYVGIASRQRVRRREADRRNSGAALPVVQPPLDAERDSERSH